MATKTTLMSARVSPVVKAEICPFISSPMLGVVLRSFMTF